MISLTDEEVNRAIKDTVGHLWYEGVQADANKGVAKAQLKKVVEPIDIILEGWRDSNSIEVHNILGQLRKLRQALLEETK